MIGLLTAQTARRGSRSGLHRRASRSSSRPRRRAASAILNAAIGIGAFVGAVARAVADGCAAAEPGVHLRGRPLGASADRHRPLAERRRWLSCSSRSSASGTRSSTSPAFTLIQRAVPDEVLARVFGVIQMLWLASMGIGAALAPALISWLGIERALDRDRRLPPALVVCSPGHGSSHRRRRGRTPRRGARASSRPFRSSRRSPEGRSSTSRRASSRSVSRAARSSSARATQATASTSSPKVELDVSQDGVTISELRRRRLLRRDRASCATYRAPRRSRPEPTQSSTRSTARTSSPR